MEIEELICKCKAISLEEEIVSKITISDIMKGKWIELVDGCLLDRVLHPRGFNKEGLSQHCSKYREQ